MDVTAEIINCGSDGYNFWLCIQFTVNHCITVNFMVNVVTIDMHLSQLVYSFEIFLKIHPVTANRPDPR